MLQNIFGKRHEKPLESKNRVALPTVLPYRLIGNFLILSLIASISVIIVTIRDNLIYKKIESLSDTFFEYSLQYGWAIDDILVEGREKTDLDELKETVSLTRENNILEVDLKQLKKNIENLPWVNKAYVSRSYFPNVLQIRLEEKDVLALWQNDGIFYPIDHNGNIILTSYIPRKETLVIVGQDAPQKMNELLAVLQTEPELAVRVKAAILVGKRRWDIIFDDIETGIKVKLPEDELEKVWKKFAKINHKYGLLKRKLTFIDLRYKNKVSVSISDPQ